MVFKVDPLEGESGDEFKLNLASTQPVSLEEVEFGYIQDGKEVIREKKSTNSLSTPIRRTKETDTTTAFCTVKRNGIELATYKKDITVRQKVRTAEQGAAEAAELKERTLTDGNDGA